MKWVGYQKLTSGPSLKKPFMDLALLRKTREEINNFRPDILHCHLHEGAFIGLLARRSSLPVLLDYQGSLAGELIEHQPFFKTQLFSSIIKSVESWINNSVGRILLNAESLGAEIGAAAKSRCRVVGDGVDTDRFAPQPADPAFRAEAGLPPDGPVIVFLGLLNHYQGADLLLETAGILKDRGTKFSMLVMGYPLGEYPARAEKMGLSRMVKFPGRIDYFQAQRWLALGDIAVAPKIALSESNGKLLNYLALGMPMVCFDRPVNRELVGDCAIYAPFKAGDEVANSESLASALRQLLDDPSLRKDLSARARARAIKSFSWEAVARRILESYQEVLG